MLQHNFNISFSVLDRMSTGIAIADIDLSLIDSVREKMPIAKVCSLSSLKNEVYLFS